MPFVKKTVIRSRRTQGIPTEDEHKVKNIKTKKQQQQHNPHVNGNHLFCLPTQNNIIR